VGGKVPSTSRPGLVRKEGEEASSLSPSPALSAETIEAATDQEAKRQITPDIIKVILLNVHIVKTSVSTGSAEYIRHRQPYFTMKLSSAK
jgi:hypothetical protein